MIDGGERRFVLDRWQRDATDSNAGYGITAVLEDSKLLEKVCRPRISHAINTNPLALEHTSKTLHSSVLDLEPHVLMMKVLSLLLCIQKESVAHLQHGTQVGFTIQGDHR